MRCLASSCFFLLLLLLPSGDAAATTRLDIVPLAKGETIAYDMNAAGQVAAVIEDHAGHKRGVFFEKGRVVEFAWPGGKDSEAKGINDSGEIVGSASRSDGSWRAFLYTRADGMRDLGTLGGASSNGTALNRAGDAVGFADTASGDWHAFLSLPGQPLKDLGTLGGKISYANGINARGQIVGAAELPDGSRHAFLYDAAHGMVDLGTLGGRSSSASAINESGVIVGAAETANHHWHAFIYNGQRMVDLGAAIGRGDSFATGINRAGHVVGTVDFGDVHMSFVWRDNKIALHHGGKGLYAVNAINDAEQVIGATYDGGLHAATMPSNAAPFVDRGGANLLSTIMLVLAMTGAAIIVRRRYRGILLTVLSR